MDLTRVTDIARRLANAKGWGEPEYVDNGASAAVFKVQIESKPAALKIYDPNYFVGDNALIEECRIALQQELAGHGCPHLVDVYRAERIIEDSTWYLLMEFCPWRSLEKKLEEVPDHKVHHLLKQLVAAVKYLEQRGLVHRDIKPANIVVSDDFERLKLLDFGVLRRIAHDEGSGTDVHKFIATAQYSPPEFLLRDEMPGDEGFNAINIYQIGAVLHDMIVKSPIFAEEKATRNKFILYKAVTEKVPRVISAGVAPRLIGLCLAALVKDPQLRAKSVSLDNFAADADTAEDIRRRLAKTSGTKPRPMGVRLSEWKARLRSWARAAAQLEIGTLGAVHLDEVPVGPGYRLALQFTAAEATIYLDAVPQAAICNVHILSAPDDVAAAPVFSITADGPTIPEAGIAGALAAQYLFAIDLAITRCADVAGMEKVQ